MDRTLETTMPRTAPGLGEAEGPMGGFEASLEANRCLYCYDAPCLQACPTHIDIPGFIRQIAHGRPRDAALTILESNLLGATCSRVCPVQELCEGACVLGAVKKPVNIGRLQRYAMDAAARDPRPPVKAGPPSGKRVAVVGAGPAGLSCAGELARRGHAVDVFEKRDLPGGLSTYGIVGLREPLEVALAEARMIEGLGVAVHTGRALGENLDWAQLEDDFDAVFLAVGLGRVPPLGVPGDGLAVDGLDFVERAKLGSAPNLAGRRVAVVGAGNTAIDCATVAKRLGAAAVTIVYRRGPDEMGAYPHEYRFALEEGIAFRFLAQPTAVLGEGGRTVGLRCRPMELGEPGPDGRRGARPGPGAEFTVEADLVVAAIGQEKPAGAALAGFGRERGYLKVDGSFRTGRAGVFAGGDAVRSTGDASTVMAVQDGKLAALAIHDYLTTTASEAVHG